MHSIFGLNFSEQQVECISPQLMPEQTLHSVPFRGTWCQCPSSIIYVGYKCGKDIYYRQIYKPSTPRGVGGSLWDIKYENIRSMFWWGPRDVHACTQTQKCTHTHWLIVIDAVWSSIKCNIMYESSKSYVLIKMYESHHGWCH